MSESRWKTHWDSYPLFFGPQDFLHQVGKTVNRVPVPASQIDRIVEGIALSLRLNKNDRLIDLCCGNGLLTKFLSLRCQSIVGIDFSGPLINVAETYNKPSNVEYICQSVLELPSILGGLGIAFSKGYMYEALQHFDPGEVGQILSALAEAKIPELTLFLGSIPDRDRIFDFYDTPERRHELEERKREGTEAIGTWWKESDVVEIARQAGFHCEILKQNHLLYTSNYRFDALLSAV